MKTNENSELREKGDQCDGQTAKKSDSCCGSSDSSCGCSAEDPESIETTIGKAVVAGGKSPVQLAVYDPPLCCSTGVCGPEVDPALVRFAADLKWLEEQGVEVKRFNLSQNPMAFVENEQVKQALTDKGDSALPLVLAGGRIAKSGRYPERDELAALAGVTDCCG